MACGLFSNTHFDFQVSARIIVRPTAARRADVALDWGASGGIASRRQRVFGVLLRVVALMDTISIVQKGGKGGKKGKGKGEGEEGVELTPEEREARAKLRCWHFLCLASRTHSLHPLHMQHENVTRSEHK